MGGLLNFAVMFLLFCFFLSSLSFQMKELIFISKQQQP